MNDIQKSKIINAHQDVNLCTEFIRNHIVRVSGNTLTIHFKNSNKVFVILVVQVSAALFVRALI